MRERMDRGEGERGRGLTDVAKRGTDCRAKSSDPKIPGELK